MIRHLLPLLFLALSAVAADPPKANAPGKGTNYAFLVGCARYDPKVLEPIKGEETVNDVIEFKKVLMATGVEEKHIVLLHDRQAEKGGAGAAYLPEHVKIVKELDLFLAGLKKDDTVVVVLSGHGVHFKGDEFGYFCPVDADLRAKTKLLPFNGDGGIYTKLEKCGAGRKLLIANACRDAPVVPTNDLAGGKIVLDDDTPENVPKGVAAIYSCEKGQKSYFDPKQGRSYFFLHLTEAWKAGGSLEDVFTATRTRTMNDVKAARKEKQFPEVKRQYEGEWVVAGKPDSLTIAELGLTFTDDGDGIRITLVEGGRVAKGMPQAVVPAIREFVLEVEDSQEGQTRLRLNMTAGNKPSLTITEIVKEDKGTRTKAVTRPGVKVNDLRSGLAAMKPTVAQLVISDGNDIRTYSWPLK